MAEPVDTGEEALEELVDTPTSKQLHAWVKERVGADNAAKGTYSSLAKLSAAFPNIAQQYAYHTSPLQLHRYLLPCVKGQQITSGVELAPLDAHLRGTIVYAFSPFWYKPLWECDKVSALRHWRKPAWPPPCTCVGLRSKRSPSRAQLRCRSCGVGELKPDGFAPKLRRVMGLSRTHFLYYAKTRCNHKNCRIEWCH